jgi:hypothetical protein
MVKTEITKKVNESDDITDEHLPTLSDRKVKKRIIWRLIKIVIYLIIIGMVIFAGFIAYNYFFNKPEPAPPVARQSGNYTYVPKVWDYGFVDYAHVKTEMQNSEFVKDLPKSSKVVLEVFNYTDGIRYTEKIYFITENIVNEADSIPENDLLLTMSSKYLVDFKKEQFCYIVKTSNKNGDLGTNSELSKTKLLWKFKSMLGYRDCLGF